MESDSNNSEKSFKEKRIRDITFIYYSRPDIRKVMLEFSENRESIPRYYEGFGKRPDAFQYETDILEQVKKGATSFHCSEELWSDPLEISTDMSRQDFDELRIGWDLLLDIDSPYLEYSKIYADLLVKQLKFYGIENVSVKFSGSKGFHIIIPWKAFPEEIYGQKTKNMFPEWPRLICMHLTEIIQPKLVEKIYGENIEKIAEKSGRKKEDMLLMECNQCNRPAKKQELITWICPNCKNEVVMIKKTKRIPKCPNESCRKELKKSFSKTIYACEFCEINSFKNPKLFGEQSKSFNPYERKPLERERIAVEKDIEADLILVAPRHLFRMPYSLHEKTALSSMVIDNNKIMDFQIKDASPFKIKIKNFYPNPKKDEARRLLLEALDWHEQKEKQERIMDEKKSSIKTPFPNSQSSSKSSSQYKQITIPNPSEDIFPPQIKLILQGVKQDGRKRALFILISFFKSLGVPDDEIEKKINNWNEKNYLPLKKGYIQSQLSWFKRSQKILPPNFDNPLYKDLGVDKPDQLALTTKNPINYAIKKYFAMKK